MQFDTENNPTGTIAAYSQEGFTINKTLHTNSILLGFDGKIRPWNTETADIAANELAILTQLDYEIILLGTGWQQYFPPSAWLAPFVAQQKSLEIMNTPAACRTYNILAAESRKVLAALFLPTPPYQTIPSFS